MDSVSQFVLGASVGLAISPVKSPKIAILSGMLATLPDLDILIDYGDDMSNMTNHRGFSHSIFLLSLFCAPLAFALQKIGAKLMSYWRWLALCLGVLLSHTLLDALTIFGTQLFWPMQTPSVMIGSMFIADLFYTMPLLLNFIVLMVKKRLPMIFRYSLNTWVLTISTLYLTLSLVLQNHVLKTVKPPIAKANIVNTFAMPTPFNLVLWRVVVMDDSKLYENFYHLYKGTGKWIETKHQQQEFALTDDRAVQQYKHFSHGFYRLDVYNNRLILSDVRMGTTTMPLFSFKIAKKPGDKSSEEWLAIQPKSTGFIPFDFDKMFGDQDIF